MENSVTLGFALAIVAGLCQGSMLVPMKFTEEWTWENTWLGFTVFGYLLLPWVFAALSVPSLSSVYASLDANSFFMIVLFGLGWGVSAVLFGLGCNLVGIALGFSIILGIGTSLGAFVPLVVLHPEKVFEPEGIKIALGVAIMITGVMLCSWAGKLRDDPEGRSDRGSRSHRFYLGLLICLISGVLNPLINFALAFGSGVTSAAILSGAKPQFAPNALWSLIATIGFVPNALYCAYLLNKNKTSVLFKNQPARNLRLAFLMGLMWIGGLVVYGSGTVMLGPLGASIGWPIFMACIIIISNVWGAITGEWKSASRRARQVLYVGLAMLVLSVFVIS